MRQVFLLYLVMPQNASRLCGGDAVKRTLLSAAALVVLAGGAPFLCLLPWFSSDTVGDRPADTADAAGTAPPAATAAPRAADPAVTPAPTEQPAAGQPVLLWDEAAGRTVEVPVDWRAGP